MAILFILNRFIFQNNLLLLTIVCLTSVILVIIVFSDLENYIIPDKAIISLGISGILFAYLSYYPLVQVIALPLIMLSLALLLKRCSVFFFGREALGMGDVKFFLVAGFYLTADTISTFFFLSGAFALVMGVLWRIAGKGEYFPFAPALCLALYLCIIPNLMSHIIF